MTYKDILEFFFNGPTTFNVTPPPRNRYREVEEKGHLQVFVDGDHHIFTGMGEVKTEEDREHIRLSCLFSIFSQAISGRSPIVAQAPPAEGESVNDAFKRKYLASLQPHVAENLKDKAISMQTVVYAGKTIWIINICDDQRPVNEFYKYLFRDMPMSNNVLNIPGVESLFGDKTHYANAQPVQLNQKTSRGAVEIVTPGEVGDDPDRLRNAAMFALTEDERYFQRRMGTRSMMASHKINLTPEEYRMECNRMAIDYLQRDIDNLRSNQ